MSPKIEAQTIIAIFIVSVESDENWNGNESVADAVASEMALAERDVVEERDSDVDEDMYEDSKFPVALEYVMLSRAFKRSSVSQCRPMCGRTRGGPKSLGTDMQQSCSQELKSFGAQ